MERNLARRRLQVVAYLALCELRDLGGELPECQVARLALERQTSQPYLPATPVTASNGSADVRHLSIVGAPE